MAENMLDLRGVPKDAAYKELGPAIRATIEGMESDPIAAMATMSCLVHHAFGHLWTGFYRVVDEGKLLRVGPYQGSLGCLEIKFGKGVCGAAAAKLETQVVPDVHAFPGHITCDGRSASEIVVPVFDRQNKLIAVFDVDSEKKSTFDETDRVHLEALMGWFRGK
ncbi:MAG: GAF domain-containing protein [Archangium sp.]